MAWPVVCGSAVAERTRALNFADGVLRVEVAGPRWKAELQALAPRYLAMINRYTTEAVRRIEFVVACQDSADKNRRCTPTPYPMKVTDKDVAYVADLAN